MNPTSEALARRLAQESKADPATGCRTATGEIILCPQNGADEKLVHVSRLNDADILDLNDPATQGVLLHQIREKFDAPCAQASPVLSFEDGRNVPRGWAVHLNDASDRSFLGDLEGDALAVALLAAP